jgi:hypothetical protein
MPRVVPQLRMCVSGPTSGLLVFSEFCNLSPVCMKSWRNRRSNRSRIVPADCYSAPRFRTLEYCTCCLT